MRGINEKKFSQFVYIFKNFRVRNSILCPCLIKTNEQNHGVWIILKKNIQQKNLNHFFFKKEPH
jgi:hypothetical protein